MILLHFVKKLPSKSRDRLSVLETTLINKISAPSDHTKPVPNNICFKCHGPKPIWSTITEISAPIPMTVNLNEYLCVYVIENIVFLYVIENSNFFATVSRKIIQISTYKYFS